MKTIITHNGSFHADDIFAVATLSLFLDKEGEEYKVIRTRDESIIDQGDFVVDVGGIYDAEKNRFDHHQIEGAGSRFHSPEGPEIPYASFGLVWKHFGEKLCGSGEIVLRLDTKIVQPIDAGDNGVETSRRIYRDLHEYSFYDIISAHLPTFKEKDYDLDFVFLKLVSLAKDIIKREIIKMSDKLEGERIVRDSYTNAEDKRLIILEENYPWGDVLDDYPEPLYVVSPNQANNNWKVTAVREDFFSFKNRKNFPQEWAGLRDSEFAKVSGISDAVFCHRNCFLVVVGSREGAIALAKLALSA